MKLIEFRIYSQEICSYAEAQKQDYRNDAKFQISTEKIEPHRERMVKYYYCKHLGNSRRDHLLYIVGFISSVAFSGTKDPHRISQKKSHSRYIEIQSIR